MTTIIMIVIFHHLLFWRIRLVESDTFYEPFGVLSAKLFGQEARARNFIYYRINKIKSLLQFLTTFWNALVLNQL